jgi:hypothetical protein
VPKRQFGARCEPGGSERKALDEAAERVAELPHENPQGDADEENHGSEQAQADSGSRSVLKPYVSHKYMMHDQEGYGERRAAVMAWQWRAGRVYFLALLVPPEEGRPDSCSLPAKAATASESRRAQPRRSARATMIPSGPRT